MARRFRQTPKFARRRQHDWQRVRAAVTCNVCPAPHVIEHPAWALMGKARPDGLRLVACVLAAARAYRETPPAPLYNFTGDDRVDTRARQAGDDE